MKSVSAGTDVSVVVRARGRNLSDAVPAYDCGSGGRASSDSVLFNQL